MTRKPFKKLRRRDLIRVTTGGLVGGAILTVGQPGIATTGEHRFIAVGNGQLESRIEDAGFEITHSLAGGEVLTVHATQGKRKELEQIPGVQHVTRDFSVRYSDLRGNFDIPSLSPADTAPTEESEPIFWEFQWDKRILEIQAAHEMATGAGVEVAIIDTGIEPGHPDLDPNLDADRSVRFKNGEEIQDDQPADTYPPGHGTQAAGVVAATGFGTVGVAPDAELISINIHQDGLPGGGLWTFVDMLQAMDYAARIGVDVVNMSILSMGRPEDSSIPAGIAPGGVRAAVERQTNLLARDGIVMAASAGNMGANLQTGGTWFFPGEQHGVLNVSATAPNDELTYYSNFGSRSIDVGAPGGGYETAETTFCTGDGLLLGCEDEDDDVPDELTEFVDDCACEPAQLPALFNLVLTTSPHPHPDTGAAVWERFWGTSAAAPQVAGVAALCKQANPDANARQIERAIKAGAEFVTGEGDDELGAGRVNAAKAVEEVI